MLFFLKGCHSEIEKIILQELPLRKANPTHHLFKKVRLIKSDNGLALQGLVA
jgi:hypothetical protein